MKNKKRTISLILIASIAIATIIGSSIYNKIYGVNIEKDADIYITSNSNFETVLESLQPILNKHSSFIWVAKLKKYPARIRAGKYSIKEGMSNNDIVNLLRSGNQTAIRLSFNNQDSLEKLAGRIAAQIEPDSLTILESIKDPAFLKKNNFTLSSALIMYIPNSYELYWNTSAENFRNRMLKEYQHFWTPNRKEKAAQQNLTPKEVSILASIVQKETQTIAERPKVAGLYLNRLKNNWALQADPTVIYAIKELKGQDVVIKRVLYKDLTIDSKYNTYVYRGLPPGQIGMPDISSINAVLNPADHQFFYMCVDIQNLGQHVFAKSLTQHNKNARIYQNWLSKQGTLR